MLACLCATLSCFEGRVIASTETKDAKTNSADRMDATDRGPQENSATATRWPCTNRVPSPAQRDTDNCNRPVFKDITEIVMVVKDLDKSVKQQWEMFGIGPWEIWTLNSSNVSDMVVHGKSQPFAIKIAYTKIGNVHWELIEPLDEKSTYFETLRERGEGVHNIVFAVDDYDETSKYMEANGIGNFNSGNWQGTRFLNFDTRNYLPVIAEIFRIDNGGRFPDPDATYPRQPAVPSGKKGFEQ